MLFPALNIHVTTHRLINETWEDESALALAKQSELRENRDLAALTERNLVTSL